MYTQQIKAFGYEFRKIKSSTKSANYINILLQQQPCKRAITASALKYSYVLHFDLHTAISGDITHL